MDMIEQDISDCIDACNACADECEEMLFTHCLEEGGKHLEPAHVRVMMDCVDICRTAARAMLRGSDLHAEICRACAAICQACADSCAALGGDMVDCAETCRDCAQSCSQLSRVEVTPVGAASTGEGTVMA
ncbi:MAG TPA: four-helix bundle copper-binding protein [Patescibacteria group bacterium]|nr:four-helix bundle copper-binding protein [Patescibacteria group bacterium]